MVHSWLDVNWDYGLSLLLASDLAFKKKGWTAVTKFQWKCHYINRQWQQRWFSWWSCISQHRVTGQQDTWHETSCQHVKKLKKCQTIWFFFFCAMYSFHSKDSKNARKMPNYFSLGHRLVPLLMRFFDNLHCLQMLLGFYYILVCCQHLADMHSIQYRIINLIPKMVALFEF